jgi:hypothetical protein
VGGAGGDRLEAAAGVARSRDSRSGAGWECEAGSAFKEEARRHAHPFSWLNPVPLWRSRNDRIARALGDPTNDRRRAWMEQLDPSGNSDLTVDRGQDGGTGSFLVLGDTGEGDESQFAVVAPLLSQAAGTDFMFIPSDVIYPAGGALEYEDKFFWPYRRYEGAIYAVPGNHDWYDDCTGFMRWFCGAETPPPRPPPGHSPKRWLRRLLWRRPRRPSRRRLARMETFPMPGQPGPYLAIDTGPLLVVGIDTGIEGDIDSQQADWLKRVSRQSSKPKILLTGKPIYVDGEHRPGKIEGRRETVDEIVVAPRHNYIAAIGGDIHNYQRYPVKLDDGRTMLYLVSGGGGAFMHETHTIPNLDTQDIRVSESEFRCYPLRGDSLSLYSKLFAAKWLGRLRGAREVPAAEAAAFIGERLGIPPTRGETVEVGEDTRRNAEAVMRLRPRRPGALHLPFSEWLDWNDAPLFKSFLRIDADDAGVRIRCFGATGCAMHDDAPPLEDELFWPAGGDGGWQLRG